MTRDHSWADYDGEMRADEGGKRVLRSSSREMELPRLAVIRVGWCLRARAGLSGGPGGLVVGDSAHDTVCVYDTVYERACTAFIFERVRCSRASAR